MPADLKSNIETLKLCPCPPPHIPVNPKVTIPFSQLSGRINGKEDGQISGIWLSGKFTIQGGGRMKNHLWGKKLR